MTETVESRALDRRAGRREALIVLGGVVAVPLLLSVGFNSWSAPDDEAYVRMAFATVSGQTVAIVTVIGSFVSHIVRRSPPVAIAISGALAAVVSAAALSTIGTAAQWALRGISSN